MFPPPQPPLAPKSGTNARTKDAPNKQSGELSPAGRINPLKSRFCSGPSGQRALGLQSLEVDDFALSASSYNNDQVRPHLAR